MVVLPADVVARYDRFTLYNSPYPAHDHGHAVDLYPAAGAPSPVAGEVVATRTAAAPSRPYAADHDHLVVVDTGEHLARILHVDPAVEPGDRVDVGEDLGTLVRSGYFAPWVDEHIHLGFRPLDGDPLRASGSLPLELAVDVEPLAWDGTGRVVATGDTYAVLDAPAHPAPGEQFVGVGADGSGPADGRVVLDGGLPHYEGGGLLGAGGYEGPVTLLGEAVGVAAGRDVAWNDVVVTANARPVAGLSLFCARDAGFGAKLVCPDETFAVGEDVVVRVEAR